MYWQDAILNAWLDDQDPLHEIIRRISYDQPGDQELVRRYSVLWVLPLLDQLSPREISKETWLRAQLAMSLATRHCDDWVDGPEGSKESAAKLLEKAESIAIESIRSLRVDARSQIVAAREMAIAAARTGDIDARCAQVFVIPDLAPGNCEDSGIRQLAKILTIDDDVSDIDEDYPNGRTWAVDIALNDGKPPVGDTRDKIMSEGRRRYQECASTLPSTAVWAHRILDHLVQNDLMTIARPEESSHADNAFNSVEELLAAWIDREHPANRREVRYVVGKYGNINLKGTPDCHTGSIVSPFHPSFESIIEPGVRDLVNTFVTNWGCVTYTSCEGHPYSGTKIAPTERVVGILPRSDAELTNLYSALREIVSTTERTLCECAVVFEAIQTKLYSDTGAHDVMDIRLGLRNGHQWSDYWSQIDDAYALVLTVAAEGFKNIGRTFDYDDQS